MEKLVGLLLGFFCFRGGREGIPEGDEDPQQPQNHLLRINQNLTQDNSTISIVIQIPGKQVVSLEQVPQQEQYNTFIQF